jgi:hypothetical protein
VLAALLPKVLSQLLVSLILVRTRAEQRLVKVAWSQILQEQPRKRVELVEQQEHRQVVAVRVAVRVDCLARHQMAVKVETLLAVAEVAAALTTRQRTVRLGLPHMAQVAQAHSVVMQRLVAAQEQQERRLIQ